MALVQLHLGASGVIRPGDVVITWHPGEGFPLHVGIFGGNIQQVTGKQTTLHVCGLPQCVNKNGLGYDEWTCDDGPHYRPDLIGQLWDDVDEVRVADVKLLADAMMLELSQVQKGCRWALEMEVDAQHMVRGAVPLFIRGSCTQLVCHLYRHSGLQLIADGGDIETESQGRVYPATLIYVFWWECQPLTREWDSALSEYAACIEFDERAQRPPRVRKARSAPTA